MQGEFNMRRLINIIHHANKSKGGIIWTVYTEKAFDKIQIFAKFAKLWIKKNPKIQESMEPLVFLSCSSWGQSTPSGKETKVAVAVNALYAGDLPGGPREGGRIWSPAALGNSLW